MSKVVEDDQEQIEFDQKCGIAADFIMNEEFRKEIYEQGKRTMKELSSECREFVELCYKNKDRFREELEELRYPEELKKFIK